MSRTLVPVPLCSLATYNMRTTSRTTSLASSPRLSSFADAAHDIVEEIVLLKTRVTAAAAADPTE